LRRRSLCSLEIGQISVQISELSGIYGDARVTTGNSMTDKNEQVKYNYYTNQNLITLVNILKTQTALSFWKFSYI
jgi:hypothetical protein